MRCLTWTPDLAKRFWDDLAGTDFLAGLTFSRFAAPYLVELSQGYLSKQTVALDFGGGFNAYLTRELLKKGVAVRLYEPSLHETQLARDIRENPRFLGTDLSITPNGYDVIFAAEVIEHLFDEDIPAVLSTIRDGLKNGGILVVTTPNQEDLHLSSRYCPTCRHLFHPWGHLRSLDKDSLRNLLVDSGFVCEAVLNVDFSSTRESLEELKLLRKAMGAQAEEAEGVLEKFRGFRSFMLPERARRLIEGVAGWKRVARITELAEDPTDRQIGAGGTLVAFARKR